MGAQLGDDGAGRMTSPPPLVPNTTVFALVKGHGLSIPVHLYMFSEEMSLYMRIKFFFFNAIDIQAGDFLLYKIKVMSLYVDFFETLNSRME